MAVVFSDRTMYEGAVLKIDEHYWADGMLEEWAVCWDDEKNDTVKVTFGYYGIDGSNLAGGSADIDATPETWRKVLRSFRSAANVAFSDSVTAFKNAIHAGDNAIVIRGRKVPKGTKVKVFWVGERETYRSRMYSWMHETETVAGCYDEAGNKLWISADYLKNADPVKSPNAKERRKFVKAYMRDRARALGAPFVGRYEWETPMKSLAFFSPSGAGA